MCIFEIIDHCAPHDLYTLFQRPPDQITQLLQATRGNDETPLWAAFERLAYARQHEHMDTVARARQCVLLLIDAARVYNPPLLTQINNEFYTPVARAILMDEFEIFQELLKYDKVWNNTCYQDFLPLEFSVQRCAVDQIIFLIGHNAPYRQNRLFIEQPRCLSSVNGMLSLILCRSLRQAPMVARLIAGIFRNDIVIQDLAPDPRARRALDGIGWAFITQCLLPDHDHAFSIVVPHLKWTVALRECCAIAIDTGARDTFLAILSVMLDAQIDMNDAFQLARLACARGRGGWAIEIFNAVTIMQNDMHPEGEEEDKPVDRLPDGTPLTQDALTQMDIIDDVISPFWSDEATEKEKNRIREYFVLDLEDSQALEALLPLLFEIGPNAFTSLIEIPDLDEDITNEAVAGILDNIIHSNDHYGNLRQLLRLPLTEALLSENVMTALEINNYEAALMLLVAGANPTFNIGGDIVEGDQLTVELLRPLAVYDYLRQALIHIQDQNQGNDPRILRALLLLCHGARTTFTLQDHRTISLVSLAQIDGNLGLVRELAALGIDPCPLFESFIANSDLALVPFVVSAFEGIHQCWITLDSYGFYGRQLFVAAFQGNGANRLMVALSLCGNSALIELNDRQRIMTLHNALSLINLNEPIPLLEQTIGQYHFNHTIWGSLVFPWNTENSRRLAFFCESSYRIRGQLTPAQRAQELIIFQALMGLLNAQVPLATVNSILNDLGRGI